MKQQSKKKKRETLPKLLAKSLCVAAALSAAFGFGYSEYLHQTVRSQTKQQLSDSFANLQNQINQIENDPGTKDLMQDISNYMALHTTFWTEIPVLSLIPNHDMIGIYPGLSKNCYATAALIDENDQIAASNRETMLTLITFQKGNDPDKGFYTCDDEAMDMPEITKLYGTFDSLMEKYYEGVNETDSRWMTDIGWPELHIDSAYIDRATRRMIPHTGSITVRTEGPDPNDPMIQADKTVETFEINVEDDAYELVELHYGQPSDAFPHTVITGIYGLNSKEFQRQTKDMFFIHDIGSPYSTMRGYEGYTEYSRSSLIQIDGKPYYLTMNFDVNDNDPNLMRHFWKTFILVTLLLCALALLWSWRQNVVNKAKYAFDDMQRDLTNHLAHDIKTPLTAIGGYAENILDGRLSADEQKQYLKSILDNVAFTDQLISRTLFLNSMDTAQKSKPEKLQAEQITEQMLKKYELMLSERGIGYSVQGCAAITADRAALETVIENLVSNAVKYTPNDGMIRAQMDKKRLTLANSVEKKIAVGNLKQPFVRGDEARSNTEGTGLGLAIAEQTALANGWKLTLSCTDKDFIAELKW